MSLYNEMRPSKWSEVKGQDNIVKVLKDNLSTNHIPNAMLFVGTRGTGKTTIAKIFAKSINCEHPLVDGECCDMCSSCQAIKSGASMDVLELDAASNNGVDNIREIIQQVQYKPIGKYKVVILDEVHMLSQGAFNALLKVMEEPPRNVIFILCTTELHKIPATILSRCRKVSFDTISSNVIVEKLKEINEKYGLIAEEGALRLVAKAAKGSMRDAESIYETFIDEKNVITESLVQETLGYSSDETIFQIITSLVTGDAPAALEALSRVVAKGGNLVFLLEECMRILLDVIFIQSGGDLSGLVEDYLERVSTLAFGSTVGRLLEICNAFNSAYEKRGNGNFELTFQGVIVSLICEHSSITVLEQKVMKLEEEIVTLKSNMTNLGTPSVSLDTVLMEDEANKGCSDVDSEPIEDFSPVEPTTENECKSTDDTVNDSASDTLSNEEMEELASLGFSVAMPAKTEEVDEQKAKNSSSAVKSAESFDNIFFGDFARQFSSW